MTLVMVKRVYILETKLSIEKVERLKNMLRLTQEYETIQVYTLADYIVTELKSPLRIMRMVKKSTCPIIHLNWLLESISSKRILNPLNYEINVSEARKQAIIDLSTRVAVRTLPKQYTWEQIAKKRSSAVTSEGAGLQARFEFARSYGSKVKSVKSVKKFSINKVSAHDTLEQHVLSSASALPFYGTGSQSNNCSSVTIKNEESVITNASFTFKSKATKQTEPTVGNDEVDMNKKAEIFCNSDESSKIKQTDANLISNFDIQDAAILNHDKNSSALKDTNKIISSNKSVDTANDSSFSIVDTNTILHLNLSYPTPEAHRFQDSAPENLNFSCSSISSIEDFDSKKFSLSYMLSL